MKGPARFTPPLTVVAVAMLATAGCTPSESPDRVTSTTAPSANDTDPNPAADTGSSNARAPRPQAITVLREYGLELPADASDIQVTHHPDNHFTDRYLVTFTAPAAAAGQMCRDVGIGGPFPATTASLTSKELALYAVDSVPEKSRTCLGSRPTDYAQQIRVLYSCDPAAVRVALYRMPAR